MLMMCDYPLCDVMRMQLALIFKYIWHIRREFKR